MRTVLLRQIRLESIDVVSLELGSIDGSPLPAHEPGAHIEVQVPGGPMRSYSLIDPPSESHHWRIAVKRDAASRGGSRWFHEGARVGQTLSVKLADNEFALEQAAPHSVFVAGGIGITPLLAMIGRLVQLGRPWELHYAASTWGAMPFQDQLARYAARGQGRVLKYLSDGGGARMDIAGVLATTPDDAHVYCCGPAGMIDAFLAAAQGRTPDTVHYERFAASQAAITDGGFSLQLARDGRLLEVPAGKTILDVLLDAGIDVAYSCTQGVCGTCRIPVLEGEPDHRDDYLSDAERATNDSILVCCSGARTASLTLDV